MADPRDNAATYFAVAKSQTTADGKQSSTNGAVALDQVRKCLDARGLLFGKPVELKTPKQSSMGIVEFEAKDISTLGSIASEELHNNLVVVHEEATAEPQSECRACPS